MRVAGQGYELDELAAEERSPNAVADDRGGAALAAEPFGGAPNRIVDE